MKSASSKRRKKVSYLDGYLTVDLGHWHFHLCVGAHKGARSAELAAKRRVAKLAFFETKGNRCIGGSSYGMRMWNGFGEQMTTVFLPNPRLSDEMKVLKEPQWDRLRLWFELRNRFLARLCPFCDAGASAGITKWTKSAPFFDVIT
ncbi:MAG TPA: hypothetical protein VE715_22430, partial [Blastocatellia bacterium]|nr:hypothetical protein [Blastocatellia bacterium]